MPKFSRSSIDKLNTCCEELQDICHKAIKEYDFAVLFGHRGEQEQNDCFKRGTTKLRYPNSKHNSVPSDAVDIAPYPISWSNKKRFVDLSVIIKRIAKEKGINIVWGGDWGKFCDMPHYEVKRG